METGLAALAGDYKVKPASKENATVAYTFNGYQPVVCTLAGDESLWYL